MKNNFFYILLVLVVIYLTVSNIILKKKIQHLAIENKKLSTALTATFPYFKKELQNLYKEIVEDRTSELPQIYYTTKTLFIIK